MSILSIGYSGEAVDGRMAAKEAASAIFAAGEVVSRTNSISNGEDSQLDTYFIGAGRGSFELLFEVIPLMPDLISTVRELMQLIFGQEASLLSLLLLLAGRVPDKVEVNSGSSPTTLVIIVGQCRIDGIDPKVYEFLLDERVRRAVHYLIGNPLSIEGIRKLSLYVEGSVEEWYVREIDANCFVDIHEKLYRDFRDKEGAHSA